ncbi:DUF6463 family protein [Tenacibaculum agarivorans]|uniref:DUF6463 family protein n=1 Tax=Tenacibaculum agarivorans TaxID=1908389 RepID=UPI00094BAF17|nr:DUF6463 family protein [Tenacibaculum agarivorans]
MKNRVGFIVLIIGVLHVLLGAIKFFRVFKEMFFEGLFNSGTGADRGWAIWFFTTGVVFIILGLAFKFIEKQKLKIPKTIGWIIFYLAIFGGVIIPKSGFWILLLPSILIIFSHENRVKS